VQSVRDKPPLRVVCMSSHSVGAFYFSQIYTDEQNTQSFTETSSQPISQNLTAIFGSNVLWILYAGGLLWVRNCAQKILFNLCALWEKNMFSVKKERCLGKLKMSGYFTIHIRLFSRKRSFWTKKTPFNIREHAFHGARTCPSWCKKGMFLNAVYNVLISWRL